MSEAVKNRRSYNSPRRREQAASTRTAILDAAQRLFEQEGFASTSMAAIAAEAGVAVKTLYLAFESKPGLLRALWNARLRGDEGELPVGDRAWFREVLAEPDPERQLRLNARNSRVVKERAGRLMEVIRDSAALDPDVAELGIGSRPTSTPNQRAVVQSLHKKKALPKGLGVDRATESSGPSTTLSTYWLLTGERGWSPAGYERWLGDALAAQLLG